MKKDTFLHIRISSKDLEMIKQTAEKNKLTLPKFVLQVLRAYCWTSDKNR